MDKMLRRAVRGTLLVIGGATVTISASVIIQQWRRSKAVLHLPDGFILELDLEALQLVESAAIPAAFSALSPTRPWLELRRAVTALGRAADDGRVKGLIGLIGESSSTLGLAQVQELRNAVLQFRSKSLAPTLAYSDAFGEGGSGGTSAYYLASAFGKVYMQPTGLLSFTGLATTMPFARGLLDRLNIRAVVFKREAFKSAASYVTGTGFTAPERLATLSILEDLTGQIVEGVARAREVPASQISAAMHSAPHMGAAAVKLGLLDGLLYRDEAAAAMVDLCTQQAGSSDAGAAEVSGSTRLARLPRVSLKRYVVASEAERARELQHPQPGRTTFRSVAQHLSRLMQPDGDAHEHPGAMPAPLEVQTDGTASSRPRCVAVVTLCGPISTGPESRGPASRGPQINSLPVILALDRARHDASVGAVVLRIDTPGGSAVASDAIHRAVELVRAAGKPVVVSMGTLAASGGYYVAAAATKILAQPGTLTGSIGVLAGKLYLGTFLRDQGINIETLSTATNAVAMSPYHNFTPPQAEQVNALVDDTYTFFLARVAAGRKLALERVKEIAKGRVWTGQQALELGLVDALGGIQDAIHVAKQTAGLTDDAPVQQLYPPPPSPVAQLVKALLASTSPQPLASAEVAFVSMLGPQLVPVLLDMVPSMLTTAPAMVSLEAQILSAALGRHQD